MKNTILKSLVAASILVTTINVANANEVSMSSGGYNNNQNQSIYSNEVKSLEDNPQVKYQVEQAVSRYANSYNNYMNVSGRYLQLLDDSKMVSSPSEKRYYNKKIKATVQEVAMAEDIYYDSKITANGVLEEARKRGYDVNELSSQAVQYSDIDDRASLTVDATKIYVNRINVGSNRDSSVTGDVKQSLRTAKDMNNTARDGVNTIKNIENTANKIKKMFD